MAMNRTTSIPWDEDIPSLVDNKDSALSIASSASKQSELLPQKLQLNNSGDSTDVSTNPSVTADCHELSQQTASGNKRKQKKKQDKKKKSKFSLLGGLKPKNKKANVKELPLVQTPHTLHLADDRGNVECYVLDAHTVRVQEQEKAVLRPVGLVSDGDGNVECRALDKGSHRIEDMKPPKLAASTSVEEEQQQCNTMALKKICMQPSTDTAMLENCGNVNCSFYDQVYFQLMGTIPKTECAEPCNLDEPATCIDEDNLNLPNSDDVVDGITKEVEGGLKLLDDTLDCVVGGLFPTREDITTIQGLAITHSETEVEMEHSDTQAEI